MTALLRHQANGIAFKIRMACAHSSVRQPPTMDIASLGDARRECVQALLCFLELLGNAACAMRMQARASWAGVTGMSEEDIERLIWTPHHTWAGEELYGMCIDLRGFYTKVTRRPHTTGHSFKQMMPDKAEAAECDYSKGLLYKGDPQTSHQPGLQTCRSFTALLASS